MPIRAPHWYTAPQIGDDATTGTRRRSSSGAGRTGTAVTNDVTYNSRIDTWFLALTGLVLSSLLIRGLISLRFNTTYALMVLGTFAFVVLILLLFCYPCRYTFKSDHLFVQSGALRLRVDYADITSVTPSRSLWSAPALSLERVRIDHRGRHMLVSPMQRERFIEELQARAAAARRTG